MSDTERAGKAGMIKRLTAGQRRLVEENYKLVPFGLRKVAQRNTYVFQAYAHRYADLYDLGIDVLIRCSRTWKSKTQGGTASFSNYYVRSLFNCLSWQMQRVANRDAERRRVDVDAYRAGQSSSVAGMYLSQEDEAVDREILEQVKQVCGNRKWDVLHMWIGEEMGQAEIARRLGITKQRVSQLCAKALELARERVLNSLE